MKDNLIALTGGIGSGKSLALRFIKEAGYYTLSSDEIVKQLYKTRRVKKLVRGLFPDAVTGKLILKINREILAKKVFSDKVELKRLTDAITPLVIREIEKKGARKKRIVVAEVPLLFERGYQDRFSKVLVITRSLEERIKSVMARSNLTREQVLARINNQVDYDAIDLSPYSVISNDSDQKTFKEKVLSAIDN